MPKRTTSTDLPGAPGSGQSVRIDVNPGAMTAAQLKAQRKHLREVHALPVSLSIRSGELLDLERFPATPIPGRAPIPVSPITNA